MAADKLCSMCRFCLGLDYGYSNYTTEGTTLECLQGVNDPLDGMEQPSAYDGKVISVESALRKAETCPLYQQGDGPQYDMDGDITAESYKDEPDIYPLLKKREAPDAR